MLDGIREYLTKQRAALRGRHAAGESGRAIAEALSDVVDQALTRLYRLGMDQLPVDQRARVGEELAIVALGGFGRRDLAPYSDVDLVFLRAPHASDDVLGFAKAMVRRIWDVGLLLGQTVATVEETLQLAKSEPISATSLLEARWLLGSEPLFATLQSRFRRSLGWGRQVTLARAAIDALRVEQHKFGATAFLLEPNVKRTAGGLRDVHLVRWLGAILCETTDLEKLTQLGQLEPGDAPALAAAHEFLLRLRNELHFHADKASDVLSRQEQLRIAKEWDYHDREGLLGVEMFMREYFRHTAAVADIAHRFAERAVPDGLGRRARDLLLSRRAGKGISIGPDCLVLTPARRARVVTSLDRSLRIVDLANRYQVGVDRETVEALRQRYRADDHDAGSSGKLASEAVRRFFDILRRPGTLGRSLRLLHQVGILSRLIPEFEHARGLLQFNAYHKYTVDEHTFVTIECAEELERNEGLLGRAYRAIHRKDLLFLALLLHDLGKGYTQDHSEVGLQIAQETAQRFNLSPADRQVLTFLVHRHLYLSHLAFHRDTDDQALRIEVTREVGSIEMLRMLYVLTVVDIMGVGPGTLTQWKADLLANLYRQTRRLFGEDESNDEEYQLADGRRQQLLAAHGGDSATKAFIQALPEGYLVEHEPEVLNTHLTHRQRLAPDNCAELVAELQPSTNAVLYTVITHERVCDGIFYKICGCLSAHHLEILSARIVTFEDGTVIDRFEVIDKHHTGAPDADRSAKIGNTLRRVLSGELSVSDALWSSRSSVFASKRRVVARENTRVVVDNTSSEQHTVVDVFTVNRRGLLHTLAKGINRLGLSIRYAKIATYADEVVDIFYVQEADGQKVHRADRIHLIQDHLASDIARLAADPHSMGF